MANDLVKMERFGRSFLAGRRELSHLVLSTHIGCKVSSSFLTAISAMGITGPRYSISSTIKNFEKISGPSSMNVHMQHINHMHGRHEFISALNRPSSLMNMHRSYVLQHN